MSENIKISLFMLRDFSNVLIILLLGSLSCILLSCDTCNSGNNPDNDIRNDIYFSAIPLNGTTGSIFAISQEGNRLREVLKNAIIYSAPSIDNKIVFQIPGIDTLLFGTNTSGDTPHQILNQSFKKIVNPILSPDGKHILVYIGNKQLFLLTNEIFGQFPTYNFCENTLPSFSPDSKYLACYEGDNLNSPLTIKITTTTNPITTILEKKFNTGINLYNGLATISWSKDGTYIVYIITDSSGTDVIYGTKLTGENVFAIKIDGIGAATPAVSPDDSSVVYAARDGNIWQRTISDNRNFNLTHDADSSVEYYLYPQFTHDGENIYFTRFDKTNTKSIFNGTLEIYNLSTKRITVLSDNVYRGFQMSK